ncbi:MAG: GNAT family N-acetyltransferase [Candidatus Bathyarchaeia archaeon]
MNCEAEIFACSLKHVENFAAELKELWLGLARETFEIEPFITPSEANSNKWFKFVRESLACEKGLLLVARSEGKIVGFLFASVRRDFPLETSKIVGVINDVYVLPTFRRRGTGRRLIVEFLGRVKELGVDSVFLSVLAKNTNAIKLYENFNFKIYSYTMVKKL